MSESTIKTRTATPAVLYRLHASQINARDAVAAYQALLPEDVSAVAMFSTPRDCVVAIVTQNSITDSSGSIVSPDCGYEIRMFSKEIELRWLQDSPETGNAVLLAEQPFQAVRSWWNIADGIPVERLDGLRYLVWGTVDRINSRWPVMTDARISELSIPVADVECGDRCAVNVVEYIAPLDDDGNIGVIEERLTSITKLQ